MLLPRLLRAKNGAPGLTPAIGLLTPVFAAEIEPPKAVGGALEVLLPPKKGSFPPGRETDISQIQLNQEQLFRLSLLLLAQSTYEQLSPRAWACVRRAVARSGMLDL